MAHAKRACRVSGSHAERLTWPLPGDSLHRSNKVSKAHLHAGKVEHQAGQFGFPFFMNMLLRN